MADAGSDAQPSAMIDADLSVDPDAMASVQVTVTADCLFLRTGPGTGNAKIACTDVGAWCNADNDVCIPMGESAEVTGAFQPGAGCPADWFPLAYGIYQGWGCGSYLAFPTSAQHALPSGHETLYPSQADGAKG